MKSFRIQKVLMKGSYRKFSFANEIGFLPLTILEINKCKRNIIQVTSEVDHPCFKDLNYVKRKKFIQEISDNYNIGDSIPFIDYLPIEHKTWSYVTTKLLPKIESNCCKEFNENFNDFKKIIGLSTESIPQLRDISDVLKAKTGFTICPVGGTVSSRVFLNALAFKIFCSAQFIRPFEKADYSAEPDVIHDIIGHCAMFADKDFAEFSQELGIASLGATEEEIKILTNIYIYCFEFGLVKEYNCSRDKESDETMLLKVYGAGIISSNTEIDYALYGNAKYWGLDFGKMQELDNDYVSLSTNYFVVESFKSMTTLFMDYMSKLKFQGNVQFDKVCNRVTIKA